MRDGGLAVMVRDRDGKQQRERTAGDDDRPETLTHWGASHRRA